MRFVGLLLGVLAFVPVTNAAESQPLGAPAASEQAVGASGPSRGTLMERVRQRYGEPETTKPAVGKPPITRWIFDDFIVYFEYDHVIHTVAKR